MVKTSSGVHNAGPSKPLDVFRPVLEKRLKKFESYEKAARYAADQGVSVSGSYLSMIVSGKRDPSLRKARKLARVFDLDIIDVIGVEVT